MYPQTVQEIEYPDEMLVMASEEQVWAAARQLWPDVADNTISQLLISELVKEGDLYIIYYGPHGGYGYIKNGERGEFVGYTANDDGTYSVYFDVMTPGDYVYDVLDENEISEFNSIVESSDYPDIVEFKGETYMNDYFDEYARAIIELRVFNFKLTDGKVEYISDEWNPDPPANFDAVGKATGDINGDGEYDNKDVVLLFRYVARNEKAEDESVYDYNGDGEVNNKDVVILFRDVSKKQDSNDTQDTDDTADVTSDPDESREDPDESREDPDESREDPDESREDPDESREDPDESREDPDESRENPDESREGPDESNDGPDESKDDPDDSCDEWWGPEVEKPIIYLYPEEKTECSVKLDFNGKLTCTYPEYNDNGWESFTAYPDGTIVFPNGRQYYALYWEGKSDNNADFSKGFCVKGEDTAEFLYDALKKLGLNDKESNEFIIYWLPRMQDNAYNLISFQFETYTDNAKLTVTPEPDTVIRVFMAFKPLDKHIEIEPQTLTAPERIGFTVVEWGGTEIK